MTSRYGAVVYAPSDVLNCVKGNAVSVNTLINGDTYHTTVNKVCLHRGYTSTTLTYEVPLITIKEGNTDWGAPKGKEVISLWLYKKVE